MSFGLTGIDESQDYAGQGFYLVAPITLFGAGVEGCTNIQCAIMCLLYVDHHICQCYQSVCTSLQPLTLVFNCEKVALERDPGGH